MKKRIASYEMRSYRREEADLGCLTLVRLLTSAATGRGFAPRVNPWEKPHLIHCLALLFLILAALPAFPQETKTNSSLEGVWKWTFTMPDGSQVAPRLEIKEKDGKLTGSTRFRPGTDTAITNLTLNGSQVSFEVARERDGQVVMTRYTGTWSSNSIKGKIASDWSGEEQTFDWDAHRSTDANGAWKWTSGFGGARGESRLTLKQEGEKLSGKISAPRGGDTDIKKGKIKNGEISFEVERDRDGETLVSRYHGKLSGNKIQGKMELNFSGQPRTNDWEAVRAD